MKTITVRSKKEMMQVLQQLDHEPEDVTIKCGTTTQFIVGAKKHVMGDRKKMLRIARGRLRRTSADAFRENKNG